MQSNSEAIIFIHIPKAAGTTLYEVLNRQYRPRHTFHIGLKPYERWSIKAFKELPQIERANLNCVRGHIAFGVHRWLAQPTKYITILRNPIERVISYYYYVLSTTEHRFHSEVIEKNMSLDDFVHKLIDINEMNLQTRLISGCVDFDSVMPPYDELPAKALDLARENIESYFAVCGLTERFDESLLLMKKILGWKSVVYMRRNVSKRRPSKSELPSSTIHLIEKNEEQDLALYEFVSKRLNEMLDRYHIGAEQVQCFQALNRWFGPTLWIRDVIYRRIYYKVIDR